MVENYTNLVMLKDKKFEGGIANVGLGDLSLAAAKFTSLYWVGEIGHPV